MKFKDKDEKAQKRATIRNLRKKILRGGNSEVQKLRKERLRKLGGVL